MERVDTIATPARPPPYQKNPRNFQTINLACFLRSEKFLSHGVELGVSGLVEGAADKEEESGDDDDDDSEDSSGSENDDDDDVDEGEGEGTHKKEASAASGGETESEGTRRSDELMPKAESLAVVGAQKTKETGGGVVLLNGSAPLAEGAHALTTSAIAPSALASVSVSVPPVGGEGDGVGNRDHEGDRDGDLVARKKLVGGEEWGNAALKLDVDEAAAPGKLRWVLARYASGMARGRTGFKVAKFEVLRRRGEVVSLRLQPLGIFDTRN